MKRAVLVGRIPSALKFLCSRLGHDPPGRLAGSVAVLGPRCRPAGLVEEAFAELARRWIPILDVFEEAGVDCAYEIHPGEDIHDGATWERFLAAVDNHPRARILFDPSHYV